MKMLESAAGQLLSSLTIVVTRPSDQAAELCGCLERAGAKVIAYPTIEISRSKNDKAFQSFLDRLDEKDLLIFNSPNAVIHGVPLIHAGRAIPSHVRIGAIGSSTAQALEKQGCQVHLCPSSSFDSEAFLDIEEMRNVRGKKVVILRAQHGRTLLGDTLAARGAEVEYLQVYERSPIRREQAALLHQRLLEKVDLVTVSSMDSYSNLIASVNPEVLANLQRATFICGNRRIAQKVMAKGMTSVVAARDPTNFAMLRAMLDWARNGGRNLSRRRP